MNDDFNPSFLHTGLEHFLAHFMQDFMGLMKQHGLSAPQIHALMYLFHAGECPVSDLAALADASPAAASQLAERLVQQGLVERREDPADRRIKLLRLTHQGIDLIRSGLPSSHFLERLMDTLTLEERQTILAAFTILAKAARQANISEQTKDDEYATNAQ